jgi:hypothetical protein
MNQSLIVTCSSSTAAVEQLLIMPLIEFSTERLNLSVSGALLIIEPF